jgi:hypothetical protein
VPNSSLRELQQRIKDGDREGDVIADPQRVVAASVHQLHQRDQFVDPWQPRAGRGLGAAVDGLDADLQASVER